MSKHSIVITGGSRGTRARKQTGHIVCKNDVRTEEAAKPVEQILQQGEKIP